MSESKSETLTFRIDAALKSAFVDLAGAEDKPVGELLRQLVHDCVAQRERRAFEAEARRQSLECAALAANPKSDEARTMQEIDADLQEFLNEWK